MQTETVGTARTDTATAGVEANARITASAAIVLLVLLAAEGATLLAIHSLVRPHVFLGFAMIPPVVVKILSTGYRFGRYYTGHAAYRRKGPPALALRVLGPAVVVLTVTLLGSGVALGVTHGGLQHDMLFVHKASFVLWFGAMTLHVLGHALETLRVGPRDWSAPCSHHLRIPHASARRWVLGASVALGVALGVWGLTALGPWSAYLSR